MHKKVFSCRLPESVYAALSRAASARRVSVAKLGEELLSGAILAPDEANGATREDRQFEYIAYLTRLMAKLYWAQLGEDQELRRKLDKRTAKLLADLDRAAAERRRSSRGDVGPASEVA